MHAHLVPSRCLHNGTVNRDRNLDGGIDANPLARCFRRYCYIELTTQSHRAYTHFHMRVLKRKEHNK